MATGDSSKHFDASIRSVDTPDTDNGYHTQGPDGDGSRSDDLSLVELAADLPEDDTSQPPQLEVSVKTMDGQLHVVTVDSIGQVKDLKHRIHRSTGMLPEEQHLLLKNSELHDEQLLSQYQWNTVPYISLRIRNVQVYITTATMTLLHLSLESSASIADVKASIFQQLKIPIYHQILYFDRSVVDENRRLFDFSRAVVSLRLFLLLNVKDITGKMIKLQVDLAATVGSLKKQLEESEDIPKQKQRLIYDSKVLADAQVLQDLGIHKDPLCYLVPTKGMKVHIKTSVDDASVGSVELSNSSTVKDIKAKLRNQFDIPVDKQRHFHCAGAKLEDNVPLFNLNVKEGSTLYLALDTELRITLKAPEGRTYFLNVDPTTTIANAKSQLEEEKGLPAGQQIWRLFSQQLDNEKTVEECNIRADRVVQIEMLAAPKVRLSVHKISGDSIMLDDLFTVSSILDIRKSIQRKANISPSQQVLIFEGRKLMEENATIVDCSIKGDSTLFLHELVPNPTEIQKIANANAEGILLLRSENEMLKKALAEEKQLRADDQEESERRIEALERKSLDSQTLTAELLKSGEVRDQKLVEVKEEGKVRDERLNSTTTKTDKLAKEQELLRAVSVTHAEDFGLLRAEGVLPNLNSTQASS